MFDTDEWVEIGRPGFMGKKRNGITSEYNTTYGKGNWTIAWRVGNSYYEFGEAILLYEDAYYHQLLLRRHMLDEICQYSEVYDNAETNVESGLDYGKQENTSNHYQDISIRRVLVRFGRWFTGTKEKLHVRSNSKQELGRSLSPGRVPFHRPDLINQKKLPDAWWEDGTVEDWWQRSKVLLVKAEVAISRD